MHRWGLFFGKMPKRMFNLPTAIIKLGSIINILSDSINHDLHYFDYQYGRSKKFKLWVN